MSNYDRFPHITVSDREPVTGWDAILETLKEKIDGRPLTVVAETYPGVWDEELIPELQKLNPACFIAMKELFLEENGLFPSPIEISFDCSCPDWALMCKHVAAAMYAIGVRLDENPFYFFMMRGIDVDRFIDVTLENKVEEMLSNADRQTERMIDQADLTDLFGIS